MLLKKIIILALCSLISTLGISQKSAATKEKTSIEGHWTGKITQDQSEGKTDFRFEIFITQKGDKITGKSYVYYDDLYAVMTFEGDVKNDTYLKFKEVKILEKEVKDGLEWCLKQCELVLKFTDGEAQLQGLWEGYTSFGNCTPGRVFLKRPKNRV